MKKTALSQNRKMEIVYICKEHLYRKKELQNQIDAFRKNPTRLLEAPLEIRKYFAVAQALEEIEPSLRNAIWESVTERTPYEYFNIPVGRQSFYTLRAQFLTAISKILE